jgi:hypothetical protein
VALGDCYTHDPRQVNQVLSTPQTQISQSARGWQHLGRLVLLVAVEGCFPGRYLLTHAFLTQQEFSQETWCPPRKFECGKSV